MEKLEQLYKIAEAHLAGKIQNWQAFSSEFKSAFEADFALFNPGSHASVKYLLTRNEVIATSNTDLVAQFIDEKIYEYKGVLGKPKNPFEPVRRTDGMTDDVMRSKPYYDNHLLVHGYFYSMGVYALMPDQSFLVLLLWRNESGSDFSDIEKLRVALFMRYLANHTKEYTSLSFDSYDSAISVFGEKFDLTKSESSILSMMLDGKSLKEIATGTERSYGTVRWHVHNLLEKCKVSSQKDLLTEFYKLIRH